MAQTFTATGPLARFNGDVQRRVLVTGAAGDIGSYFASHSHDKYELRLMVRNQEGEKSAKLKDFGEVVTGDITDLEVMKKLCAGVDTVVHMAGDRNHDAAWHSLLNTNIIGAYNVFVAAKSAGCRRVIYASSVHATSGYSPDLQVKTNEPVNPGNLYGVTKCFGEALARYMAEQEGLSSIALRIGAFQPVEVISEAGKDGLQYLDSWVSPRDMNQLIQKCIDVENVHFAILYGVSNNRFRRFDISDARELLGYEPQDDSTAENKLLKDMHLRQSVGLLSQTDAGDASGIRDDV